MYLKMVLLGDKRNKHLFTAFQTPLLRMVPQCLFPCTSVLCIHYFPGVFSFYVVMPEKSWGRSERNPVLGEALELGSCTKPELSDTVDEVEAEKFFLMGTKIPNRFILIPFRFAHGFH
jgi:hypothetical protein